MNASADPHADALASILGYFDVPGGLIYGIGNDGRQDDGLGWALVEALEQQGALKHAQLFRNFQLQLEDAELISHHRRVLFVDATKSPGVEAFELAPVLPRLDFSFTSHEISAASILATCRLCFGQSPEVWMLAIRGYEWELRMGLTPVAMRNLRAALHHLGSARADTLLAPTRC